MFKSKIVSLILGSAILFCSCSATDSKNPNINSENQGSGINGYEYNSNQTTDSVKNSRIYKISNEYFTGDFSMTLGMNSESTGDIDVTYIYRGGDVLFDVSGADGRIIRMLKDNRYYTILPELKAYSVEDANDESTIEMPILQNYGDWDENETYITGTTVVSNNNGDVILEYESSLSEPNVKYCFDGDTLVYIINDEDNSSTVCEVKELTKDFDADVFNIPSDYEQVSPNNQ